MDGEIKLICEDQINITKEQEEEIIKLRDEIEEFAYEIAKVNEDNIQEIHDSEVYSEYSNYLEKLKEYLKEEKNLEISELALAIIEKYDVKIYGAYYYAGFDDNTIDLLTAKTVEEFIKRLREFRNGMEWWKDEEIDAFDEWVGISKINISDAEYIVKVYRTYPCWADGQLEAVIKCNSKEEAEKVSDYVWRNWGDFGVPGGNISTRIEKVDENTEREIKDEVRDDYTRLSSNHHRYEEVEILDADDVIDVDEEDEEEE